MKHDKVAIVRRAVELLEQPDSHIQFDYWQLPGGDESDSCRSSAVSRELAMKAEAFCPEGAILRACYEAIEDDTEAVQWHTQICTEFVELMGSAIVSRNDGLSSDDLHLMREALREFANKLEARHG